MVTSRSESGEGDGPESAAGDRSPAGIDEAVAIESDVRAEIPAAATPDEAAAIVAAMRAHLEALEAATHNVSDERSWDGNRWAFVGRVEQLQGSSKRVPRGTPTDAWTATARTDRF